ncbi:MAG: thiol peroxidase [Leptolinea sp.]|nr:thiol peroxidase [Leptolinea sp.]
MLERKGLIQYGGKDATILGEDLKVGQQAPSFKAHLQDWSFIDLLKLTRGKVRIIASVPSLDTEVCDREIRKFNEQAASLSKDVSIIVISMDLPFAQKRWCGAAGIDQVLVVSDHVKASFGKKYGCLLKDQRLLRRAVFVVDQKYKLTYVDYMKSLSDEPDYAAVLNAAKKAI